MKSLPINTFAPNVTSFLIIASCVVPTLHSHGASAESFLPEIIIRAENAESNDETSLAAWVTSQSDIQARNAVSVSEALEQVPGLNVQYGASSGEARAWIRGFRDRETLILYDGIPLASAYDGTVDLAEVSSQGVAQIRTIKSAPSVIYGINGLSGVVDINPSPIPSESTLSVNLQLGSEHHQLLQVAASSQLGSLGGSLHVSKQRQRNFPLPEHFSQSHRLNSDFDRTNLRLRLSHDSDTNGQTSLLLLQSSNSKGLPPELYTDERKYERLNQAKQRIAALTHQFENIPVSAKIYESSYDFVLDEYASTDYASIVDSERSDARTRGAQIYGHFKPSDVGTVTASLTATQETLTSASAIDISAGNRSYFINTALEYDFVVTDQLALVVGGIATYFKPDAINAKSVSALNPQFAAEWAPTSAISVRLTAAQRTRFPKLVELFGPRYGNPEVTEAESNNMDMTIEWRPSNSLQLSSAVYRYDIRNLIEKPTRRSPYANVPAVDIEGIEITVLYSPSEIVALRFSSSEVRAEEILDSGARRQLRSRPKTSLLAQGDFQITQALRLTVSGTYTNGLFDIDDSGLYREVETSWALNGTVHYQLDDKLRIYAEVANAIDDHYEHKIGFPRPGRQFKLGLNYDF